MERNHVIRIQCQDQKGLIAKISGVLYENHHNVLVMKEYVEQETDTFFARLELTGEFNDDKVYQELRTVLPAAAQVTIVPKRKKKIILLVTKEHHCLTDLLIRHHFDELQGGILSVIGNHSILGEICG